MPICTNCHHQWTRRELWKASLSLKPSMTCPHCGAEQYQTKRSRKKTSMLLAVIPVTMLLSMLVDWGWGSLVLYLFIVTDAIVVFYPKGVELTGEEEPLW
ncbi:TIGR04104 family putative zinc finger protein [Bhargavaea ullalensis]|uniref:CXXC-20-CXXC protein n=1 Tax=Bhargavaea ullalensis TaxID=1265685 RepID=A0ABV2GEC3_9BACL